MIKLLNHAHHSDIITLENAMGKFAVPALCVSRVQGLLPLINLEQHFDPESRSSNLEIPNFRPRLQFLFFDSYDRVSSSEPKIADLFWHFHSLEATSHHDRSKACYDWHPPDDCVSQLSYRA